MPKNKIKQNKVKKDKTPIKEETGGWVKPPSYLSESDQLCVNNLLRLVSRAKFSEISMEEIAACMASYSRLQTIVKSSEGMSVKGPKVELKNG